MHEPSITKIFTLKRFNVFQQLENLITDLCNCLLKQNTELNNIQRIIINGLKIYSRKNRLLYQCHYRKLL